jgi:hypothetical protein
VSDPNKRGGAVAPRDKEPGFNKRVDNMALRTAMREMVYGYRARDADLRDIARERGQRP